MHSPLDQTEPDRAELLRGLRSFAFTVCALDAAAWLARVLSMAVPGTARWTVVEAVLFGLVSIGLPLAVALMSDALPTRRAVGAMGTALFVILAALVGYGDIVGLEPVRPSTQPSWVCVLLLVYALRFPAPPWVQRAVVAGSAAYLGIGAAIAGAAGAYGSATAAQIAVAAGYASAPTWVCGVIAVLVVQHSRAERARYERAVRELEQLGSYTLETKLGQGGMGEVWRAQHAFLARPAAVKIIRPEVLSGLKAPDAAARARAQLALGRFEREAKATAQLTSAHTIRVFDFGEAPNDTFFYVMELLDGLDLHSLVKRYGAQPQERVRHILLQTCDSLAEAHDRGMVHRDVKPANLFLCKVGKTLDHVKVLDFGLVRSDPGSKPEGVDTLPRLTRQGIISGSPAYMSPEQAEGHEDLDRRADIYALGCVAYFLLAGVEPFQHDNPMMLLMHQVTAAPEPISRRNRWAVVAPELEALVLRMLAKQREDRPSSADELIRLLRALPLPNEWTQERAAAWWARVEARRVYDASFAAPDDETEHTQRRLVRKLT